MDSHKRHKNHKRMLLERHPCRDQGREKDFPPTRPQELFFLLYETRYHQKRKDAKRGKGLDRVVGTDN